tara:strand:+ start:1678 stop:1872 length:195 start_codon:yes stop_codon:yes gene_type:complete
MKYKNIKTMLRAQVKNKQEQHWTWDQKKNHFTMIYEAFNSKDRIYTPTQLLEEIDRVLIENETK